MTDEQLLKQIGATIARLEVGDVGGIDFRELQRLHQLASESAALRERLVNDVSAVKVENDKLQAQLAAVRALASGQPQDVFQKDWSWSAAYGNVIELRKLYDTTQSDNAALRAALADIQSHRGACGYFEFHDEDLMPETRSALTTTKKE